MAGLLNSFQSVGRGLLALPGQIVQGYGAAYGALPGKIADAATQRQLEMEQERQQRADAARQEELINKQYANDPLGELAARQSPAFVANLETAKRAPWTGHAGDIRVEDNKPVLAFKEAGINGRTPYTRDPVNGAYQFQAPRALDILEQADIDQSNKDYGLKERQLAETARSNKAQEGIASRGLSIRAATTGAGAAPRTVQGVAALVAQKVAAGIPLSPGEQQIYDSVINRSSGFMGGPGLGYGGVSGAPSTPAARAGGLGDPLGIRKK